MHRKDLRIIGYKHKGYYNSYDELKNDKSKMISEGYKVTVEKCKDGRWEIYAKKIKKLNW